jgi:hypothetical protein
MYSFSRNSEASAPISTFMCPWAIYIVPGSAYLHISSSRIGRPIEEIYKSLTDAWMWKLELRPRYSFSGNICFKISVFCLCSVVTCPSSRNIPNTNRKGGKYERMFFGVWTQDFPLHILFLSGNLLFTSADLVSGLNIFSLLYISLQYQEGRVSQLEKAVF